MTKLTEHTVLARTRAQDLKSVKKLNAWGSELTDVSIVKSLPNVEVLSLSVNSIASLQDFSHCNNLQELYLRKNNILDLGEIRHLRELSKLRFLWLADNPCALGEHYRPTVIRNLPQLQKLDNITIQPEEQESAKLCGIPLEAFQNSVHLSQLSPVENVHETTRSNEHHMNFNTEGIPSKTSTPITSPLEPIPPKIEESVHISKTYIEDTAISQCRENEQNIDAYASQYYSVTNESQSNSVGKQISNAIESKVIYESDLQLDRPDLVANERFLLSGAVTACSGRGNSKVERNAAMKLLPKGGRNRNANILSAVLCLIKELDLPSLEVVDTAVHCQMEELEAEQDNAA